MKNNIFIFLLATKLFFNFAHAAQTNDLHFDMKEELSFTGCVVLEVSANHGTQVRFFINEVKDAQKQLFKGQKVRLLNENEAKEYCKSLVEAQDNELTKLSRTAVYSPFWIEDASDGIRMFSPTYHKGWFADKAESGCIKFTVSACSNDNSNCAWNSMKDLGTYCTDLLAPHCTLKNGLIGVAACAGGCVLLKYGGIELAITSLRAANSLGQFCVTEAQRILPIAITGLYIYNNWYLDGLR